MNKFITLLLFGVLTTASNAVDLSGKTCEEVYSVCLDNSSIDVNGTQTKLSEISGGPGHDCWDYEKVYRCIDDDWTQSCTAKDQFGNSITSVNAYNYTEVVDEVTKTFISPYDSAVVATEYSKAFFQDIGGYVIQCPDDSWFNQFSGASNVSTFTNNLLALDCVKESGWDTTNSSTSASGWYVGQSWSGNLGRVLSQEAYFACTTDVSSTCDAIDVANCPVVGYIGRGSQNDKWVNVPECGNYEYCEEYRECEQNVADVCDSDVLSCEAAHSATNIYHPVITDEVIGTERKYTCYEGVDEMCSSEVDDPGYSSCQWSYFDCTEYDSDIVPSENYHNGRPYGQCKVWTDHYTCPNDVVVTCTDERNSCGAEQPYNEVYDAGGSIIYWDADYICYDGTLADDCVDSGSHEFHGCVKVGATCVEYDATNNTNPGAIGQADYGTCVKWEDDYICPSDATYTCDKEYDDCRPEVIRPGTQEYTDTYDGANEIDFENPIETGRIDDYYCWTGDIDEICAISDGQVRQDCNWTGYTCHETDPHKEQPNMFDGRDYRDCISWTDNWVCDNAIETTCDKGPYQECGPVGFLDNLPDDVSQCFLDWQKREEEYQLCVYNGGDQAACRASHPAITCPVGENDTIVVNPDDVWTDWSEQYVCYTGDFIESCEEKHNPADIHECQKTGFTCLVDDPIHNTDPDPVYGTCKTWVDRYVCGSEQYVECDTEFEMCHSKQVEGDIEYNNDGVEIFRRESEFCYTDEYNESLCALENDKCYLYDTASSCEQQRVNWMSDTQSCTDAGFDAVYCASNYPEPTCKQEVECPTGFRPGTNCQLDWEAHDAAMQTCFANNPSYTVEDCEAEAPLPECAMEDKEYLQCEHAGFVCHEFDLALSEEQAANNNFEGRNYGYCVDWEDNYICPQNQWEDCMGSVDRNNECSPLGYVEIYDTAPNGQATDYITKLECVADPNLPDCQVDPSCELVEIGCSESKDGLCVKKKQIWSCIKSRTDCVEYDLACANPEDYGLSVNEITPADIGQFLGAASTAKMISENTSIDSGFIEIFKGKHKSCRRMDKGNVQAAIAAAAVIIYWTGDYNLIQFIAAWSPLLAIDYNCCRIDNTHAPGVQGSGIDGGCNPNDDDSDCSGYEQGFLDMVICNEDETELARSRGAKTTVGDFGRYCTEDILGYCLERGYSYCEFDNMFSRIVQEQGRAQIEQALTQGASGSIEEEVSFNYYTGVSGGAWNIINPPNGVNNNKLAIWQWDSACLNHNVLTNPPENVNSYLPPLCPYSDEVHIAVCTRGNGCHTLPDNPYSYENTDGVDPVQTDYRVMVADPNEWQSFALSQSVFLAGQCGTTIREAEAQAVFYGLDYYDVGDTVQVVVPAEFKSGSTLVAEFGSVTVNWGDGSSSSLAYQDSGSMAGNFVGEKIYQQESGFGGYDAGVVLTTLENEVYSTSINFVIMDGAVSNSNSNAGAGTLTIDGAVGSASPSTCNYKFTAYPSGGGASTSIGYDVNWTNGVYIDPAAADQVGKWSDFEYEIGSFTFIPYEYKETNSSQTTVKVKINNTEYDLPKDTGGSEVTVGPLRFIGSCNDKYKTCTYRAYRSSTLALMEWGPKDNPNCRGFTTEEIEALDFGRMDLSEWIATLLPKQDLADAEKDSLTNDAIADAQTKEQALRYGAIASDGKVRAIYYDEVAAHPRETFQFNVISRIDVNSTKHYEVQKVRVNWGDGTPMEEYNYPTNGRGFVLTRAYNKTSSKNGFNVQFALEVDLDGRTVVYETSVRILIGYAVNTIETLDELGGGIITLKEFSNVKYDAATNKQVSGGINGG